MEAVAPEDWPCKSLMTIVDTDALNEVEYRHAVRAWIDGLSGELAGDLLGRYSAREEAVSSSIYVAWREDAEPVDASFSSTGVDQILDQCATRGRPELILLAVEEESDNGFRIPGSHGECFLARFHVRASRELPGMVSFGASGTYWSADGRIPDSLQGRWLNACARFCEDLPLTFGCVSGDGGYGLTSLDMALGRSETESVRASRSILRGYSWVTVCSPEIVERLGGVAQLEESEQFWRVRPLASGGMWLQATEHLEEYESEVIERVFRVFVPVLPDGLVEPIWGDSWPTLVHADASQYRDSGS